MNPDKPTGSSCTVTDCTSTAPSTVSVFLAGNSQQGIEREYAVGTYYGKIMFTSTLAANSPVVIPVTLVVAPPLTASPSSMAFTASNGGAAPPPQFLSVGSKKPSASFTAVTSGGSWLSISTTSGTTPIALSVSVNSSGLAAGIYSGSISLALSDGVRCVSISSPMCSYATLTVPVSLTVTPPPMTITSVVNAASFQTGPIAPGEIVSIGGSGIGPAIPAFLGLDKNGRVSTELGGVQLFFNGTPAPLIYVSAAQINAVVPYEVGNTNPLVQVSFMGKTSNALSLTTTSTNPALFTANGTGSGPAAILNQDNSYNGPDNPAPKGSYITVYLTGEGQTSPPGVTGQVTTVSQVPPVTPRPTLPVAVLINGQPASIAFYGEAPTFVSGVMQLNIQIPANAPSGILPIQVSVGGNSSPSGVTVFVQ